ncbi:MAG TPA: Maf family protein [Gemmatimonadales bacterium]|nr:Maf family protein [Gemmatimonadales bacterium]
MNGSLILASSSPRRRQLLDMLQIPFTVIPAAIDERRIDGEAPERYVVRLAREKAASVSEQHPGALVLGADTTVVVRGELLAKPESAAEAEAMLAKLRGRTHHVMTGVALVCDGRIEDAIDISDVTFRALPDAMIASYVATGEPMDKAGAYAVQGLGAVLIQGIRGDFFSVMGLPLRLVVELLERFGRPYRFTR